MRSVSHREMRNNSGDLLRSVEAGESVIVTNRGKPIAIVSPFKDEATPLEELRKLGHTRPAQASASALRRIERVRIDLSTDDLLRDSRREW